MTIVTITRERKSEKEEKVSAESKSGALHLRLPKDESAEPKSAEITVT